MNITRFPCFLRYNPHNYVDDKGVRQVYSNSRETKLIKTLEKLKNHQPPPGLSAMYLYYDGYNGKDKYIKINYKENTIEEYN